MSRLAWTIVCACLLVVVACGPSGGGADAMFDDAPIGACDCLPTEECQVNVCIDVSCFSDTECPANRFCNGTICVDDVCAQGSSWCVGQDLHQCSTSGDSEDVIYTCTNTSTCNDDGMGNAACDCVDDWDCPANTRCEGRVCTGTGSPASCLLPPEPFTNALPVPEITWGGTSGSIAATGSPFSNHAQVVQAATVANLDDDNGDGLIDDRDIPEIIFTSYCNSSFTADGVIRAIHGGGPNKGQDYLAVCGTVVWKEGDAPSVTCSCASADLDSTASIAVGDLNYDGKPEIVAITENDALRIYSNEGDLIALSPIRNMGGANPAPSIANVDNSGFAEIIVGRIVFAVHDDGMGGLTFGNVWEGTGDTGRNGQGPASCVANIIGDNQLEIVAGSTAYRFPVGPSGITLQSNCTGAEVGDEAAWCNRLLPTAWDTPGVGDGFCSIADVWGADATAAPGPSNPLDDQPELVLVSAGNVYVIDGTTGGLVTTISLPGTGGGPPNIDDFDGDGYPEVGVAGAADYVMIDFQSATVGGPCDAWTTTPINDTQSVASVNTPRTPTSTPCSLDVHCGDTSKFACNEQTQQCICLHNSWRRRTEDSSSRVTGSSVFDFNGDGAAEVVYNDECRFRIYDGLDGTVYMREPSESRTRIEYPIIADVDNDGNAEIVFSTSNESGFCSESLSSQYNNGIEVWGDQNDFWVPARRIWNQHAYNVTNISEDGTPPLLTPQHWRTHNGRTYNLYRSNPRNVGIAPDLVVTSVQFSSVDMSCGALGDVFNITARIENQGDTRGGQGAVVGFYGEWLVQTVNEALYADLAMTPLTFTLLASLDPGGVTFVTVVYDVANNSPMTAPDSITVIVDDPSFNLPNGAERECDENNNDVTTSLGDAAQVDLWVTLGIPVDLPLCPTVPTTVNNNGAVDATNVLVRYYAGDPFQGGTAIHDEIFASIVAGGSDSRDVSLPGFPTAVSVTIFAVIDPNNAITECNDGNNSDNADAAITCGGVQ